MNPVYERRYDIHASTNEKYKTSPLTFVIFTKLFALLLNIISCGEKTKEN